jgi:hypothetical protein
LEKSLSRGTHQSVSPLRGRGLPVSALPPPGLHASYSRQRAHGLRSGRRHGPDQLYRKRYSRCSSTPGSPSEGRHHNASLSSHRVAPATSSSVSNASCRPPREQAGAWSSYGKDAAGSEPLWPSSSLTGTTMMSSPTPCPSSTLKPPPSTVGCRSRRHLPPPEPRRCGGTLR